MGLEGCWGVSPTWAAALWGVLSITGGGPRVSIGPVTPPPNAACPAGFMLIEMLRPVRIHLIRLPQQKTPGRGLTWHTFIATVLEARSPRSGSWCGLPSWPEHSHLLTVSHVADSRPVGSLFGVSSYKGTNPTIGAPPLGLPSTLITSSRPHLQVRSPQGLCLQPWIWGYTSGHNGYYFPSMDEGTEAQSLSNLLGGGSWDSNSD